MSKTTHAGLAGYLWLDTAILHTETVGVISGGSAAIGFRRLNSEGVENGVHIQRQEVSGRCFRPTVRTNELPTAD